MTTTSSLRRVALMAGLLASCGIAAAGIASTASSDSGTVAEQGAKLSAQRAQLRAEALNRYSVLRHGSPAGSDAVLAKARSGAAEALGLSAAEAGGVVATVARADRDVRVVVSGTPAKGVCLDVRDAVRGSGSSGCADTALTGDATKPLVSVDLIDGDRWRITALLVDGISTLSLTAGGQTRDVAVADNVATTTLGSGPFTLRWVAPDGSAHALDGSAG